MRRLIAKVFNALFAALFVLLVVVLLVSSLHGFEQCRLGGGSEAFCAAYL